MKKNVLFSFLSFLLMGMPAFAQVVPIIADDILLKKKVAENPDLIQEYIDYEKNFKILMDQGELERLSGKTDTFLNGKRVIPVVVHIIHNYGPENISDEQVLDAIAKINIDYNLQNADTVAIFPLFKPRAANCDIEFRLAKIDPNGNCTNGIEHIYDPGTNWGYFATMKTYFWPTTSYLNVYVVNFIYPEGMALPDGAFIGGMSPFPPDNLLSQALTGGDADIDGVLIRQDCFGSIGTAIDMGGMGVNAQNRTFTHEMGHYFNLYHPFQNLMLGLLPASSGCHSFLAPNGDEVSDTPPVAAASQNTSLACYTPGSRNTCTNDNPNEPDMIENYMDYQWGFCTNIFTTGQKNRIVTVLNGIRRDLWSVENLIATGVLDTAYHPACTPIADFNPSAYSVCLEEPVYFSDFSYNGTVDSYSWSFPGGNPASSTDDNPVVTYSTPGLYDVQLIVTNAIGSDTMMKTSLVRVLDPANVTQAPIYEDFESGLPAEWQVANQAGNGWEITDQAYVSGTHCIRLMNQTGNTAGSKDEFITKGYDLTTLSNTVQLRLKFKYAYTGKIIAGTILTDADTAWDKLRVLVSTNCGKTWVQRYIKQGIALETTPSVTASFVPTSVQWANDSLSLQYYLNQHCTNLMIKFEFYANSGNNIYIDDINIDNGTYTTMDDYSRGFIGLDIYPNPVSASSVVSFDLWDRVPVKMEVYDILGNKVFDVINQNMESGEHQIQMDRNKFNAPGYYMLHMIAGDLNFTRKFIVQ